MKAIAKMNVKHLSAIVLTKADPTSNSPKASKHLSASGRSNEREKGQTTED